MLTFAITGVTGLIGSNLLYEIIKNNRKDLKNVRIVCFGRKGNYKSLAERLYNMIQNDGCYYFNNRINSLDIDEIFSSILPIEMDFGDEVLGISQDNYKKLAEIKIDNFYHLASLTELRNEERIDKILENIIYKGTQKLLDLIKKLPKIGLFNYISSAYVCGKTSGIILPDFFNPYHDFRNPYEKYKSITEYLCRSFCFKENIPLKIFRPTIVAGRIIEYPIGFTTKYDVFYSWISFLLYLKKKLLKTSDWNEVFNFFVDIPIRIYFNPNNGLNIVGADFCAKVIYKASFLDNQTASYHIASKKELSNIEFFKILKKYLKIEGITYSKKIPEKLNSYEKMYYNFIGKIFTPYIAGESMLFNIDSMLDVCKKGNIHVVNVDTSNITLILDYAKNNRFGLE